MTVPMTAAELAMLGDYATGSVTGVIHRTGRGVNDKGNFTVYVTDPQAQEIAVTLKGYSGSTAVSGFHVEATGDYSPDFQGKRYLLCDPGAYQLMQAPAAGAAPAPPPAPALSLQTPAATASLPVAAPAASPAPTPPPAVPQKLTMQDCLEVLQKTQAAMAQCGFQDERAVQACATSIVIGIQRGDIEMPDLGVPF